MVELVFTDDSITLVDDLDLPRILAFGTKWSNQGGYAVRQVRRGGRVGKLERVWLHRFVLCVEEPYPEMEVDHIDGNTLNNRKRDLRRCTKGENQRNRRVSRTKSGNPYKGVFYDPSPRGLNPWRVKVRVDGVLKSYGRFSNAEEAARRYEEIAKGFFGEHARLNFKEV